MNKRMGMAWLVALLLSQNVGLADVADVKQRRAQAPALAQAQSATVLVEAESAAGVKAVGSGCLIDPGVPVGQGLFTQRSAFGSTEPVFVLTCSHILGMTGPWSRPPRHIQVTFFAGTARARAVASRLVASDRDDVALLCFDLPAGVPKDWPRPLTLGSVSALVEGTEVHLLGYPQPGPTSLHTLSARVSDLFGLDGHDRLATKGYRRPLAGCSGGPLINAQQQVVGIQASCCPRAKEPLGLAVTADAIRIWLAGRVDRYHVLPPYRKGKEILLPLECILSDPLRRVAQVQLEAWQGPPGRPRIPAVLNRPTNLSWDPKHGSAQGEIAVQENAQSQRTQGHWLRAVVFDFKKQANTPADPIFQRTLTPLERSPLKPARLHQIQIAKSGKTGSQPLVGLGGRLLVRIEGNFLILDGPLNRPLWWRQEAELEEVPQAIGIGSAEKRGGFELICRKLSVVGAQAGQPLVEGAERDVLARLAGGLTWRMYRTDQGLLRREANEIRALPAQVAQVPAPLIARLREFGEEVARLLELTDVVMPAEEVPPLASWEFQRQVVFPRLDLGTIDIHGKCGYLGLESRVQDRPEKQPGEKQPGKNSPAIAWLRISGRLHAQKKDRYVGGQLLGTLQFRPETGQVVAADFYLDVAGEPQRDGRPVPTSGTVVVKLERLNK